MDLVLLDQLLEDSLLEAVALVMKPLEKLRVSLRIKVGASAPSRWIFRIALRPTRSRRAISRTLIPSWIRR
jgi:hypothetical protein